MKKLSFLLAILTCATALSARTIYLVPNNNWLNGSAKFSAAYYEAGSDNAIFISDFLATTDGIHYRVDLPETAIAVQFVRYNPENATTPSWDNKWDQTRKQDLPTDGKDCFFILNESWSDSEGDYWASYDPVLKFYITGDEDLVGADLAWKEQAIPMEMNGNTATYTFTDLPVGKECEIKITMGCWSRHWGYTDLNIESSSTNLTELNTNIRFIPAEKMATVTFDENFRITFTGNFATETFTPGGCNCLTLSFD